MSLQDNNDSNMENTEIFHNEPPPKRQREVRRLDWRSEPSQRFSDWRIVITDQDGCVLNEYHVHKVILAFGERASDYFASLFETDMMEHQEQCSTTPLSKTAAQAFPHLLDFIYQNEIEVDTPELFLHLYPLKEYFQVVGMDKIISLGIFFEACKKDYETLILLDKTALELGIDTANDVIFTPMKLSFVQYLMEELITQEAEEGSRVLEPYRTLRLEFLLESVKHLDQELSAAQQQNSSETFINKYCFLLQYINFSAQTCGTRFPLKRDELDEAFGDASSGIWQIKNFPPDATGRVAFLSLIVLGLEDNFCEPQKSLSRSQKAAIDHFHRLASMDGMSPHGIVSECNRVMVPGMADRLLSAIRGNIVARLTLPGIAFSTLVES